ncbi:uncharacterized protein LOC111900220 [Lactuca sativa]|uniref:BSD domain-containing protein n=1 Tax=Lactuca sativa TaxID=4236 RepID=A0A9R1WD51_LACSA|nr:uncharacterized protein LOC111900220 [Lactuca sativa]KAJ0220260.1 hypothetical protein LSAT_V11C200080170 [Lactuca sativa]
MSWFARSITNTLKLDDNDDDDDDEQYPVNKNTDDSANQKHEQQAVEDNSPQSPGRGVKEDLSEITKTLTRQFWGVASFLAPPVASGQSNERSKPSDPETSDPEAISGIRKDFAEIGGKLRSGISKLSNNIDVSEITKMASDFLHLESEDEDYDSSDGDGAVGVTDEVVAFAKDIAMHPETWLDFPVLDDEDDDEDFHLSDAQQEHALAIEDLAPRLSALRVKLCPDHMTETSFWKIYFVHLHPKLEHNAAKLLSTPKIVRARSLLLHELKNRQLKNEARRISSCSENMANSAPESPLLETLKVKHPIESDDIKIVDKSVIQHKPHDLTKDEDEWLKEESSETVTVTVENDVDVSFSDLEDDDDDDDDDGNIPIHYKKATYGSDSSRTEIGSWVELDLSSTDSSHGSEQVSVNNSETKESNDWFDVVDIDVV